MLNKAVLWLLTGQGIGNALSGLFGGVAGAGATVRTVVNVRAGGRTPLSGALHSVGAARNRGGPGSLRLPDSPCIPWRWT